MVFEWKTGIETGLSGFSLSHLLRGGGGLTVVGPFAKPYWVSFTFTFCKTIANKIKPKGVKFGENEGGGNILLLLVTVIKAFLDLFEKYSRTVHKRLENSDV